VVVVVVVVVVTRALSPVDEQRSKRGQRRSYRS